jgi:hypothetical protein
MRARLNALQVFAQLLRKRTRKSRRLAGMPQKPDWRLCVHDRRFDRYRNRVARLFRENEAVGFLLVTAVPYANVLSGHFWWRKWSTPREMLWAHTVLNGSPDSAPVPEPVQDELDDYAAGVFRFRDEVLRAEWLSASESVRLREAHFSDSLQ